MMENLEQKTEMSKGVQSVKQEHDHLVVDIIWKDGFKSQAHFPVSGFVVVDKSGEKIGHLSGEQALAILKQNSAECLFDEFSWVDFV